MGNRPSCLFAHELVGAEGGGSEEGDGVFVEFAGWEGDENGGDDDGGEGGEVHDFLLLRDGFGGCGCHGGGCGEKLHRIVDSGVW